MKKSKKIIFPLLLSTLFVGALSACGETNNPPVNSSEGTSVSSQHYTGEGKPDDSIGNDGDTYTDSVSKNEYVKVNGHWLLVGNSNPQQLEGEGVPNSSLGNNGDFYTDTTNGNIYNKQNGTWVLVSEGDLAQVHEVVFDLDGGQLPDGSITVPKQNVKHGEWVKKPEDPYKKNCTFLGWFADGSKWSFTNPVYGDLVLIARYQVNESEKVTLTIDPNNGEDSYQIETFAGDTPKIQTPVKEGSNFVGWYIEGTNEKYPGYVTEMMNGVTLVAKFEKSKFNVTYQLEQDNTVTITGILDIYAVNINVPATVDGYTVTSIGEKAFQNRIYLTSISLPSTIKNIHRKAFTGARMLSAVQVDANNPYFTSVDGVLYSKDMTEIVLCAPKNCTSFTLPSSITKIGDYAFYGHKESGVGNIYFNEGLVEIGERAFYENTALKTLKFPSTLKRIGSGAFNCVSAIGNLQDVRFNDGLEEIGDMAFVGAYFKDAFSLPSTVRVIGGYAFANCTAITKFTFPRDLETLGGNAFSGATGILTIDIEEGNKNFVVKNNLLYTSDMKKVVMCPSGNTSKVVIEEGVEEIADYAFYMVDRTQEYEFPSTLKTIGKQAFAHCYDLREFVIPDSVTSIGENCFDLCESLKTVTIGAGLREIPSQAFIECYSLSELVIPSNIETIGKEAFFGCSGLKSIEFNEGLISIGNAAFNFSTTESNIYDTAILSTITLPDSLEVLGDRVFVNQKALKTVNIGSGLKEFGSNIFQDTGVQTINVSADNQYFSGGNGLLFNKDKTSLYYAVSGLSDTLVLEEGLKRIEKYAFDGCKSLSGIEFPDSLEVIGEGAFKSTKIATLNFKSGLKKIEDGAFYLGSVKEINFEEGVEEIGMSAFHATDIETLTLPNSLISLGETAFAGSWKLNSLTIGTGLKTIGNHAFMNCKKLVGEVSLPSGLQEIGIGLFVNDIGITDIKLVGNEEGNYVVENGLLMDKEKTAVYAYATGNSRTSLTIPSTVTEIKDYGLCGAEKLTSLTLPSSLKTIGEEGLTSIVNVSKLVVPSSVTYIARNAFNYWGYSKAQQVAFECSEDYTLMHFDEYYLGGSRSGLTVVYDYQG